MVNLAKVIEEFIRANSYVVLPSNDVKRKQEPKLQTNRYRKYLKIIKLLMINPYPHHSRFDNNPNPHIHLYDAEHLNPHVRNHYSLRLSHQDRVVYTIEENSKYTSNGKLVKIYECIGHYTHHRGIQL